MKTFWKKKLVKRKIYGGAVAKHATALLKWCTEMLEDRGDQIFCSLALMLFQNKHQTYL
jgi:hypothetical protein